MRIFLRTPGFLMLLLFVFALSMSYGDTTYVNIVGLEPPYYSPGSTLVKVGDTIQWTNVDSSLMDHIHHTVNLDNGQFDSATVALGGTITYTFTSAGMYPYHCNQPMHTAMHGTTYVYIPQDTTPPANVTNFTADGGNGFVQLGWTNPTNVDFFQTKILRKIGGYPSGAGDSSALMITQTATSTYIDSGVTNGTIYYYGAFSGDTAGNFASGSFAVALPQSLQSPSLSKLPGIRLNTSESLNTAFNLSGFNTGGAISNYTVTSNIGGVAVDNSGNVSYTNAISAGLGNGTYIVSNIAGSQTTSNLIKYSTYRFATTQTLEFFVDHGTVLGDDKGDTIFNLTSLITPTPSDSVYFYTIVGTSSLADIGKVSATISNNSILSITLPTNATLTSDVKVYVTVAPDSTSEGDFDTLIIYVKEILPFYSQFNQSSDTTEYAYENAPGTTGGLPTVNWLPTYRGATGVVQFTFTTAGQGVKVTLLRPNWVAASTGQWYTLKMRVISDVGGVNTFSPLALVFSGDPTVGPTEPTEVSGVIFVSVPTTSWTSERVSVLAEDTAALYPQFILKNGTSTGSIYLDYVDIFPGKPNILAANGSTLSGPPGGLWSSSTALTSWAFQSPPNYTESSYAVTTGSLDVIINGTNQGVKVTGVTSPGLTYTQPVYPKQPVGLQASLSSSGSVTNPFELLVLLGDTTAGGQGIEELGATAAIYRVPVQNNGVFLAGYDVIANPFIYPQFQIKGSGSGHIYVGDTQILLDNDIVQYYDASLLPV